MKKRKKKTKAVAIPEELQEVFEDLTPKQSAWLMYYLESGNAAEAVRRSYDLKSKNPNNSTARTIGAQNLAKLRNKKLLSLFMSYKGLDVNHALNKLREGLDATKATNAAILVTKKGKTIEAREQGLIEVADYAERRAWWDRFMSLMGIKVLEQDSMPLQQQNVMIVPGELIKKYEIASDSKSSGARQ